MDTNKKTTQKNTYPKTILAVFCLFLTVLGFLILVTGQRTPPDATQQQDVTIMKSFDLFVQNTLDQAHADAVGIPKQFWLAADADKGPVPDPDKFGTTNDPSSLGWLLEDAQSLLQGQKTLFSTDITLMPGSVATYYLDDSIFAITWKQVIDASIYTISEIKISHPSQFRRHLEGGVFDGFSLSTPTLMSQSVNAVVGSSADHYLGRRAGIIVYDGEVKRIDLPQYVDVCYIDEQGNLIFSYAGELTDKASAQKFVDENNISFSLTFGPILVDNGERREISNYLLGEVNDHYARSALCQMDNLHYLVITANVESGYWRHLTINEFGRHIEAFGCKKVYTMDGGNTGSIVMNGKLINRTTFGYERYQGDLLYFCTAVPNKQ